MSSRIDTTFWLNYVTVLSFYRKKKQDPQTDPTRGIIVLPKTKPSSSGEITTATNSTRMQSNERTLYDPNQPLPM